VEFIAYSISLLKIAIKQFLTGNSFAAIDLPELPEKNMP
jgi:hypothetical protein